MQSLRAWVVARLDREIPGGTMHPGEAIFMAEFFLWCGLVVAAPLMTVWALFRSPYRRAVAVTALGLWCTLAGGALKGSMWSWMATENQRFQLRKIAALPDGAKPADVNLAPMKAIVFFVELDKLGRRLGYLTLLLPLLAVALVVRKTLGESPAEKRKSYGLESELFTTDDLRDTLLS